MDSLQRAAYGRTFPVWVGWGNGVETTGRRIGKGRIEARVYDPHAKEWVWAIFITEGRDWKRTQG